MRKAARTPRRVSWRAARFLVIDVETTGLDLRRDAVISFAAVPVEEGRVMVGGLVSGLVEADTPPSPSSIRIHGLRAQDLAGAPSAARALVPLGEALHGRIPVAHVAWIERGFLGPGMRAAGTALPSRFVDTALLWRLLCILRGGEDPGLRPLAEIVAVLGLPGHRPHEAEGDALTTAQLFLALATHLERHGRGRVGALMGAASFLDGWRRAHPPG
jgi:DNA polymerase-3 subunit epsilon